MSEKILEVPGSVTATQQVTSFLLYLEKSWKLLVLRLSKSTKSALFIEQETDRNVPVEANYHPTFGPADEMETDAVAGGGWVLGQGEAHVTGGISPL